MSASAVHLAVVSIGSNIEPELNLERARDIVAAEHRLVDESPLIRTDPEGYLAQPDFLNGAWLVETSLEQTAFVAYLKGVEDRLGRQRGGIKAGPRKIDLDLIGWDGRVVHAEYPAKDYVAIPVDALLRRHGIGLV
ncbi:2-amino-4-hydroxy-6-hydroxymethyldihydropteridine diphosphokinase [Thiohalocapsa sp. ML1]|uniref:2-amino-4-hydroxy-6- hydroxymethyldihydropteridine diphosphokinase n=1 Tax=Thiohalocapsa sp. ML1 TaxID=1431688 RepID=UPI000732321D|nr:2-amino-4-hydroxy-6-hydroxymethyldihydropteridine diphosphokinase [Thiohalocapsa sp. ML1]